MSDLTYTKITYRSGCHMCYGLGVQWSGEDAKNIALKHARQTGHKGIWYEQETIKVYDVTEDMTMADWEELEQRPAEQKPPTLVSDLTIGCRIRAARRAASLTQAQLAEQLGMVRTTLIAIEQGERHTSYQEISAIATLLGTTVDALTAWEAVPV